MVTLRGSVLVVFSILSLALAAPGQGEIGVSSSVLDPGVEVAISYSNENMAGETIILEIYSGEESEYVIIELDENGDGEGWWTVSEDWYHATFNAEAAQEITRWIHQPS